jgi:PEGA domain/PDZ domain
MNAPYVRSKYVALFVFVGFSLCAATQDKPRVFMAGRGTINGMTHGSAGGTGSGSGWWAAGRTDSIVDSHDESMELARDFASNCPGAQVTVNPDAADYVTGLNRESKAKKGLFSKNNQIQVSNKAGDVLLASTVRSVATAAKDACNLILSDFAVHGHARPVAATTPVVPPVPVAENFQPSGQASPVQRSDASTELDITSTPPNADIEIDGSFVGNTPSSLALAEGQHAVKITKNGYKPWARNVRTSKGSVRLVAELEAAPPGYVAPASSASILAPVTTPPASPLPAKSVQYTIETSAKNSAAMTTKERGPMTCASLGIKTESDLAGAKISEITPASVAAGAGLHVGDIINSIDGKRVRGPADLESELQNRAPSTSIRVGYMFRSSALGYFSKEAIFLLP